ADIYLSWDTASGVFKITSTATDPSTGTHTTLEANIGKSKLTNRVSDIEGDARVVGNSLMKHVSGDDKIRETLLSGSSATVSDIPDDASVEAAYLYWSGWKLSPAYDEDDIDQLADLVDEATLNGAAVTASRVQMLENQYGWSYSAFKDVTSYLEPEQSATITFNPVSTVESATITNQYDASDADIRITADGGNPGDLTVDGQTISPGQQRNIAIENYLDSVELTAGSAAGEYNATIEVTGNWDVAGVDGGGVDDETIYGPKYSGQPHSIDLTLNSTQTSPEATITKNTTSAYVNITASGDNPGDITLVEDAMVIPPGATEEDLWYNNTEPSDTLRGATLDHYEVTITCTDGMVIVAYDSNSVVLGESGSQMTNGTYTVGGVEADAGVEGGGSQYEWAYAGWSLIIIYSSPSEEAHQLFLYDDFLYAGQYTTHTFTVTGFLAPSDSDGTLTCFVGEGDEHYDDDYIKFNDNYLSDAVNPWDNVWNSQSSGLGGLEIDGVDIDTFDVESYIDEGDTSAVIELGTDIEIWNVVYLFLSFRTEDVPQSGQRPVGIISYGY
ncbi:hypothetical protein ACFLYR_09415, partial [Chloroflexota bacterium]